MLDDDAPAVLKVNGDVQPVNTWREAIEWLEDGANYGDRFELSIPLEDEA
jgi:hypothetical protein